MDSDWDGTRNWRRLIERRLNEIGSRVHGNQSFQSDRVSDLVEQIDELRHQLKEIKERQDKIADYVKKLGKRNHGRDSGSVGRLNTSPTSV